ncbi:tRNA threonylcarbamoyladenosine biosynthesis protein TsaE [bacterium HR18]|uniref:tRNA threonylcarbamoyladenosine biosynthesis protein TsaE n=1 Tax=Rhodothermus marinus TaxID=29549 RepID=A0A7V2B1N9_RHOMR|nr:tRNA threonylcarbamoyladenosine biosynthesis protein TsaE [bacterium HR18]
MKAALTLADLLPCETDTPEATRALGKHLARRLHPGDVVALYGELGSGKTQLVKGIAEGLGIPEAEVNSPTFTLLHIYLGGRLPLYHFDAYRLRQLEEFYALGYEEYFFGEGVSIVEWAERIEPLLPPYALRLHLEHLGNNRRRITYWPT